MAALNWQSRVTTLNSLTLAGADAANRTSMVSRVTTEGQKSDAAYTHFGAAAVDGAKATGAAQFAAANAVWAGSTNSVHVSADRCARFIVGGDPIAFAPDGSAGPALFERLSAAENALDNSSHPKRTLAEELEAHDVAARQAYGQKPTAPIYSAPYTTRTPILGGIPGSKPGKNYNLFEFERDILQPLIDEADLLIDSLT